VLSATPFSNSAASRSPRLAASWHGPPVKITFGEKGVCGLLVYRADYRWSHSIAINGDQWPDDLRLFDIEDRFICTACGHRAGL
jgi:hypothetical protein